MALISNEEDADIREVLRAEDEAIAKAAEPDNAPADLAALTEILRNDRAPAAPLHEAPEGDGGSRR